MKSDLYTAIAQLAAERGIPREAVLSSVEQSWMLDAKYVLEAALAGVYTATGRRGV